MLWRRATLHQGKIARVLRVQICNRKVAQAMAAPIYAVAQGNLVLIYTPAQGKPALGYHKSAEATVKRTQPPEKATTFVPGCVRSASLHPLHVRCRIAGRPAPSKAQQWHHAYRHQAHLVPFRCGQMMSYPKLQKLMLCRTWTTLQGPTCPATPPRPPFVGSAATPRAGAFALSAAEHHP
jgi:hypothetical protein